jgi:hypothetical protein
VPQLVFIRTKIYFSDQKERERDVERYGFLDARDRVTLLVKPGNTWISCTAIELVRLHDSRKSSLGEKGIHMDKHVEFRKELLPLKTCASSTHPALHAQCKDDSWRHGKVSMP